MTRWSVLGIPTILHNTHLVVGAAEQRSSACIEDGVCGGARGCAFLGYLVLQVLNHQLMS